VLARTGVNCGVSSLNVNKYGLTRVVEGDESEYRLSQNGITVILEQCHNLYSLFYVERPGANPRVLASRFMCETQEQLDFLVLNSRVGGLVRLSMGYHYREIK
jgi:hypothetical protein